MPQIFVLKAKKSQRSVGMKTHLLSSLNYYIRIYHFHITSFAVIHSLFMMYFDLQSPVHSYRMNNNNNANFSGPQYIVPPPQRSNYGGPPQYVIPQSEPVKRVSNRIHTSVVSTKVYLTRILLFGPCFKNFITL